MDPSSSYAKTERENRAGRAAGRQLRKGEGKLTENDDGGSAVSHLLVLRTAELDHALRRRVGHVNLVRKSNPPISINHKDEAPCRMT